MVIRITFSNSNIRYFDTILTKLTFLAYLFSYFFNSYFVFTLINQNLCKERTKKSLSSKFLFSWALHKILAGRKHTVCVTFSIIFPTKSSSSSHAAQGILFEFIRILIIGKQQIFELDNSQ